MSHPEANRPENPATSSVASGAGSLPAGTAAEILGRVLDLSAACIADPAALAVPGDELHQEILLPLLPAMLGDNAIRQHWRDQVASGFIARIQAHLEGHPAPEWQAGDFEIHVAASYLAGPDAKALADTLLSEESLRELTTALMNQVLGVVWAQLPAMPPPVNALGSEPIVEAAGEAEAAPPPVPPAPIPALVRGIRVRAHPIAATQRLVAAQPRPSWLAVRIRARRANGAKSAKGRAFFRR